MANTIYKFDVVSHTWMSTDGEWTTDSDTYYYAVIPLQVGKWYKITLQNKTTITRYRCGQSNVNVIGEEQALMIGYNDSPTNGFWLSFKAEKNYLLCYGGQGNGAEVSLMEIPSTITNSLIYNGNTTEMASGKTATLACNGKKAISNIAVAFGTAGTIKYNGTETSVESGKTATLLCADKKMKSDVVVALGELEDVLGTWVFNEFLSINTNKKWSVNFSTKANSTINMTAIGFNDPTTNYPLGILAYYQSSTLFQAHGLGSNWWSWSGFKTITITGGADATNPEFICWLKACATKK
jgi:hypothetical protein